MFIISFSFGYIINLLDLLALRLFIIHFGFIFDSFGSTSTSFYSFLSFWFLFFDDDDFIVFFFESGDFRVDFLDGFCFEEVVE